MNLACEGRPELKSQCFNWLILKFRRFEKIKFVPCALSVLEQLMSVIWCDTLTLCLARVIWGTSKRVIVLVMRPRRGKNNQSLWGMFFIGFLPKCPHFYGEPAASPIRKDAALAFYRPLTPARLQHLWPNLYAEVVWREWRAVVLIEVAGRWVGGCTVFCGGDNNPKKGAAERKWQRSWSVFGG